MGSVKNLLIPNLIDAVSSGLGPGRHHHPSVQRSKSSCCGISALSAPAQQKISRSGLIRPTWQGAATTAVRDACLEDSG
eukprot:748490-Hanusia_phi.AAC.1